MNNQKNSQTNQGERQKKPQNALGKSAPDPSKRYRKKSGPQRPRNPQHQKPISNNIYSAIDLGTNNCRLLVAQQTANGFKVIDSFSRVVRLGEGLSKSGTLSPQAIERTIEALDICVSKIKRRGVTHMRNVATQACREATNCNEFIERVEKEVRIKLNIIDPMEEARLAVMGCKALLDRRLSRAVVFDIGGGSTELIWVKVHKNGMPEIIDWTSIPFGVVNMSEEYGTMETISEGHYAQMRRTILEAVEAFEKKNNTKELVQQGKVQLLGTSGTITTLTSMHLELESYDRNKVDGASVHSAHIRDLCQKLSVLNYEERVALKSIGADRADLVVAGCAILETIMDLWPVKKIKVADRGIREGMLLDMMDGHRKRRPNNQRRRNRSKRNGAYGPKGKQAQKDNPKGSQGNKND